MGATTDVRYRDNDGATVLSQEDLAQILAGSNVKRKVTVENISDHTLGTSAVTITIVQSGTSDGSLFALTALDALTLSRPWGSGANGAAGVSLSASGAGGNWGSTGTKGVVVTALNATGETVGSVEATFNLGFTTQKATYTWNPVPGATKYRVRVTNAPGNYTGNVFVAELVGVNNTTYVDDGTGRTAANPLPTANTTGGLGPNFGDPTGLTFTSGVKSLPTLAVGQQAFYWVQAAPPGGTTAVGNRRAFLVQPAEV